MEDEPRTWVIYAIAVVAIVANPLIIPSLPEVLADFGQPDSRAGIVISAVPLPGVLVAPIAAILADRLGRRRVLIPSLIGFGATGVASAFAPTFSFLIAMRLLQGAASASLITLAAILIVDNWTGEARTRLLGRSAAAVSVGLLALPVVAGLIAAVSSWRWSVGLAVVALPLAPVCARLLPDTKPLVGADLRGPFAATRQTLRVKGVRRLLLPGLLLSAAAFGVLLTAVPLFLDGELGVSTRLRGVLLALPAVGSIGAGLALAKTRQVISLQRVFVGAALGVAVSSFLIGAAASVPVAAVGILAFGAANGFVGPALQDNLVAVVSPAQSATVLASWVSVMRLGQALGPLALGASLGVVSVETAIQIGGTLLGVAALILFLLPNEGDGARAGSAS